MDTNDHESEKISNPILLHFLIRADSCAFVDKFLFLLRAVVKRLATDLRTPRRIDPRMDTNDHESERNFESILLHFLIRADSCAFVDKSLFLLRAVVKRLATDLWTPRRIDPRMDTNDHESERNFESILLHFLIRADSCAFVDKFLFLLRAVVKRLATDLWTPRRIDPRMDTNDHESERNFESILLHFLIRADSCAFVDKFLFLLRAVVKRLATDLRTPRRIDPRMDTNDHESERNFESILLHFLIRADSCAFVDKFLFLLRAVVAHCIRRPYHQLI